MPVGEWVTANGGPLALVVLGIGVSTQSRLVGFALIGIGVVTFFASRPSVRRRIPWAIVRVGDLRLTVTMCVISDGRDAAVLQLYVTLLNRGTPTTLNSWRLVVEIEGQEYIGVHLRNHEPAPNRPMRPLLAQTTGMSPLPVGEDDGVLFFLIVGATMETAQGAVGTLGVKDQNGHEWTSKVDIPLLASKGVDTAPIISPS